MWFSLGNYKVDLHSHPKTIFMIINYIYSWFIDLLIIHLKFEIELYIINSEALNSMLYNDIIIINEITYNFVWWHYYHQLNNQYFSYPLTIKPGCQECQQGFVDLDLSNSDDLKGSTVHRETQKAKGKLNEILQPNIPVEMSMNSQIIIKRDQDFYVVKFCIQTQYVAMIKVKGLDQNKMVVEKVRLWLCMRQ